MTVSTLIPCIKHKKRFHKPSLYGIVRKYERNRANCLWSDVLVSLGLVDFFRVSDHRAICGWKKIGVYALFRLFETIDLQKNLIMIVHSQWV